MTQDKQEKLEKLEKQKQLNQDYADFLIEYEAAIAQGNPIGGFIAWRHANRDGIKIPETRKK
jgi:hypothetical protein